MPRRLEVMFVGMACFHVETDDTYVVYFPDGRKGLPGEPPGTGMHHLQVWVRERSEVPLGASTWPVANSNNDFEIPVSCDLVIDGVVRDKFNNDALVGRLSRLKDSDPKFVFNPKAGSVLLRTKVDFGTLSAHRFEKGMIVVKWVLHSSFSDQIKLRFKRWDGGDDFALTLPPTVTQVALANVGYTDDEDAKGDDRHFVIYRLLGQPDTGALGPAPVKKEPEHGNAQLIEPSLSYLSVETPRNGCSPSTYP